MILLSFSSPHLYGSLDLGLDEVRDDLGTSGLEEWKLSAILTTVIPIRTVSISPCDSKSLPRSSLGDFRILAFRM